MRHVVVDCHISHMEHLGLSVHSEVRNCYVNIPLMMEWRSIGYCPLAKTVISSDKSRWVGEESEGDCDIASPEPSENGLSAMCLLMTLQGLSGDVDPSEMANIGQY